MWVRSLGQENSLEEEMATRSSILAWEVPWTEEPGVKVFLPPEPPGLPSGGSDKESTCQCRRHKRCGFNHWIIWSLGCEDPLEEEMATYSSFLAWRIPWTDKPARPQSIGLQSVRHERRNLTHKVFSLGQT